MCYHFSIQLLPGIQVFLGCINVKHLLQSVSYLTGAFIIELVITHAQWSSPFEKTKYPTRKTELFWKRDVVDERYVISLRFSLFKFKLYILKDQFDERHIYIIYRYIPVDQPSFDLLSTSDVSSSSRSIWTRVATVETTSLFSNCWKEYTANCQVFLLFLWRVPSLIYSTY